MAKPLDAGDEATQAVRLYLRLSNDASGTAIERERLFQPDEQLTQHAPGKPPLALTWSDITKVKTNKSSQRLELRSNITSQAIMIEYQVQGFDELRDIIARTTGQTVT